MAVERGRLGERGVMSLRWRTATFVLALLLVGAVGWALVEANARRAAMTELDVRYQQQFFEALGHVENLEVLLAKVQVSTAPRETIRYLSELWQHAFAAQASLGTLPVQPGGTSRTQRFLSQLGDYSFVLGQRIAEGEGLQEEDLDTLRQLQEQVEILARGMTEAARRFAEGTTPWREVMPAVLGLPAGSEPAPEDVPERVEDDFLRIERQMEEFPTLVYDGPFSDHLWEQEPRGLGEGTVDEAEAVRIARNFFGDDAGLRFQVTGKTQEGAPIQAWTVEVAQARGDVVALVSVSRQGGHPLWMIRPREVGAERLTLAEAEEVAAAYLEERGFDSFVVTYPVVEAGRAVIPFVLVEDGTLIYSDQVKVIVALDDGEVVGFDAVQYYSAHAPRDLPEPRISEQDARRTLHPDLEVTEVHRALIPKADGSEVLTYEFRARHAGNLYHVYVNVEDGRQEQLLRIIETEGRGRLAQ